nr:diguanylate cyclase [uncultured Desulfuromonas sp.]
MASSFSLTNFNALLLRPPRSMRIKIFLLLLLPLWLLGATTFLYLEHSAFDKGRNLFLVQEQQRLDFSEQLLLRDLDILLSDISILSDNQVLLDYIGSTRSSQNLYEQLARRFSTFLKDRAIYDQLRYIDENGMEHLRLNYLSDGKISVSPPEALQNKKQRYYFDETMRLAPGEIYLSLFDLNVEHGQIEKPYRPMLRISVPMYDSSRIFRGILILNYRAQLLLDRFKKSLGTPQQIYYHLLNYNGYWLSHHNREKEWGFATLSDVSFRREYAEVWAQMSCKNEGLVVNRNRGFLFKKCSLLDSTVLTAPLLKRIPQRILPALELTIVSEFPFLSFPTHLLVERRQDVLFVALFLALVSIGCWRLATVISEKKQWSTLSSLLSHSVESAPSAFIVTDRLGHIQYINSKFTEISGYLPEEVIGQKPDILKSGETSNEEYRALWQKISSGEQWQGTFHNCRKDGTKYWVEAFIAPLMDKKKRVIYYVGIQHDITEKLKLQHKLEFMASHDTLTGVFNRQTLSMKLNQDLNRSLRYNHSLAVCLFDVDHFKNINDTYGHHAGDAVLCQLCEITTQTIRNTDYLARYGGEEFVLILPETDLHSAEELADRLRQTIANHCFDLGSTTLEGVSVSMGLSAYPQHATIVDDLLKIADEAMYAAKRQGRNRIVVAALSDVHKRV